MQLQGWILQCSRNAGTSEGRTNSADDHFLRIGSSDDEAADENVVARLDGETSRDVKGSRSRPSGGGSGGQLKIELRDAEIESAGRGGQYDRAGVGGRSKIKTQRRRIGPRSRDWEGHGCLECAFILMQSRQNGVGVTEILRAAKQGHRAAHRVSERMREVRVDHDAVSSRENVPRVGSITAGEVNRGAVRSRRCDRRAA